MKNNVYKILTTEEWEQASKDGQIKTDLDKEDGFIHLSFASQLHSTLSRFFDESDNAKFMLQRLLVFAFVFVGETFNYI